MIPTAKALGIDLVHFGVVVVVNIMIGLLTPPFGLLLFVVANMTKKGRKIEFRQSNSEGQIIDWIHEAIDRGSGIIINPVGYSFTSIAILDALKMFPGPVIELHIANIHRREEHYHHSYVSKVATAVIAGLGPGGYRVAVRAMLDLVETSSSS
jgi:3-dehydroquinate dehydratase-2